MKSSIILSFLCLALCFVCPAQTWDSTDVSQLFSKKTQKKWQKYCQKELKKESKYWHDIISPNGVEIGNGLWIDQTEIANVHWLEYLHYLVTDSGLTVHDRALPDTVAWAYTCWNSLSYETYEPFIEQYLRYPGYRYYPVVGITFEQAQAYCEWRSNVVNSNIQSSKVAEKYHVEINFRLPTPEEWEIAAAALQDTKKHPFGFPNTWCSSKGIELSYISDSDEEPFKKVKVSTYCPAWQFFNTSDRYAHCNFDSTIKIYGFTDFLYDSYFDYNANGFGIYNIIGNMAEFTSVKGVAKGGSWQHPLEDCAIEKVQYYNGPTSWLGLRCVATVSVSPIKQEAGKRKRKKSQSQ
ncbi:MAG: hypothetical protein EAZ57_07990 [Cytophagales bacterium]|nr:MAG: hypothetical protein EAZ67_09070 [Cytophagales bacterium]TAF60274.1 MAG: hypothetical protein EAZ57_07990 [Cytophagales bacterium]